MKVSIQEIPQTEEEEIIIRCHKMNDSVLHLLHKIKSSQDTILGFDGDEIHRLHLDEIFYFETVDNKSFLYYSDKVFETKLKLYEFEQLCEGTRFFRASKSIIINSEKVAFIKPLLNGRFEACLVNGEKVAVSRQFVPNLKKLLGL